MACWASKLPVVVRLPASVTVPVAETMVTVSAVSVDPNVAPPTLVSVTEPRSVPTAPVTLVAPRVSKAMEEVAAPAVPLMAPVVTGVAAPAPRMRLAPSASWMAGRVMAPVLVPPIWLAPETLTGLVVARLSTPVPWAETEAPARVMEEGAVAVRPPSKAMVPENATEPVLSRVTGAVTAIPVMASEYALAAVVSEPRVAPAGREMVPVVSRIDRLAASTALLKTVPPVLVRVRAFTLEVGPDTARVPVVLMVRFSDPIPVTWVRVMAPVPVASEALASRVTPASFSALFVVVRLPPSWMPEEAVETRPPVKVSESVAESPRVTTPVFCRVTPLVTATLEPVRDRSKAPAPVDRLVTARLVRKLMAEDALVRARLATGVAVDPL